MLESWGFLMIFVDCCLKGLGIVEMAKIEDDDSSDEWDLPIPVFSDLKSSEPITEDKKRLSSSLGHLKSHFVEMGFPLTLVDKVIDDKGDVDASMLLETLINFQESNPAASSETMKKHHLKEMGFTEDEISLVINNFGPLVPISELADAIFAKRFASEDATEDQKEQTRGFDQVSYDQYLQASKPDPSIYDSTDTKRKRPNQTIPAADHRQKAKLHRDEVIGRAKTLYNGVNESEGSSHKAKRSLLPSEPPYLFFAVGGDISQQTWMQISGFLFGIDPEFADAQRFSAISRNEGYIHNLPVMKRVHIRPNPPLTIDEVLPNTKKWRPDWDTRRKLSCVVPERKEALFQCQKLEKLMRSSRGMLNNGEQAEILRRCKAMNLIWTGQHRLSPLEPEEMECILGYPKKHTDIPGISLDNRLQAFRSCFQIDTLAYHLSALKSLYPEGVKVLSVFSGIGGAELAFHKLGIPLLCVVSVEPVESNKEILRKWWKKSEQVGELIQFDRIEEMTMTKLDRLVKEIGGFDIVIGSNPCMQSPKTADRDGSAVLNFSLFNEFARVYKQLESMKMKRQ